VPLLIRRLTCVLLFLALAPLASANVRVVASIYPLAMIATTVARADTEVKLLVPTTATVHNYQLTPGDLKTLAEADIIVWSGAEAEPYLAGAMQNLRPSQRVVTLSRLPGVVWREHRLDPGSSTAFGRDPHLWMSTRNAALLARALGAQLGNPIAAEFFDAEMQRFRARQLKRFAPVAKVPLLAAHDAYGYLFDEIGLANASAVVIDPEVPVAPRRVAELQQRIEQERIACMIGEPGFDVRIGTLLFPSGHGNLVVIDPQLVGTSINRNSYTLAMTNLAETLYGCIVTR